MITAEKYVEKVEEIYNENPSYRTGGDGSDGTCDCIGMCRGASERAGATGIHNMRGTNNAVRHLDLNLQQLAGSSQLQLGDIVMRTRDKDDPNMPLPDQYRKGGSDYSEKWGETNFTHIGTVTKVYPLEITHMTSPHAKKDTSIKNWTWFGHLPWVERGEEPGPGPDPDPDPPEPQREIARVDVPNKTNVITRKGPDSKKYGMSKAGRIPQDSLVEILKRETNDKGEEWCYISWQDQKKAVWYCWVMGKFLVPAEDPTPSTDLYVVHIPYLTKYKAQALVAAYPGAWMTEGEEGGDDGAVG